MIHAYVVCAQQGTYACIIWHLDTGTIAYLVRGIATEDAAWAAVERWCIGHVAGWSMLV